MGAKLSVAQFLSASFGELLDLRGRYSHSSQVFAAAAAAAPDICIDPFRAPPPRRCHRKKEGEKWGNEREGLFPPRLGWGRNWRRYCCRYRIFLPI